MFNILRTLTFSKASMVLLGIVILLILVLLFGIGKYKQLSKFSDRQSQNLEGYSRNTEAWRNQYGELVVTSATKLFTLKEAKNTSDKSIQKLISENERLGNKLKRTEYILGIQTGMHIDTVVKVRTIIINDTLFKYLDSLSIASFKLIRTQLSNEDTAHYDIKYNPELYLSINWHKQGSWKLKNICKPRLRIYDVDLRVNDNILKPSKLDVVKFTKK